ncbi:uncharacterized protein LOC120359283 [Solenopsis invicta]|uniref:uncharacterized protein LOC120359283 n=1 Tax=Solenopsis invicta TaxID=13686 RepID=UPI00193E35CD|nr:uncharacterized protein LOC120359283 [Solenopsis invicta]
MVHFTLPFQGCIFLPEIPYVKIKLFKLPDILYDRIIQETAEYQDIISTINNHEASMLNHETSTCLMLFSMSSCYNTGRNIGKYWATAIQESQENKIVSVLGGVCLAIYSKLTRIDNSYEKKYPWYFRRRVENSPCVAVLITGLIQTYSIVLEKECNTEEQIEAKLQLFKNEVKLRRHSIGFMFESTSSIPAFYLFDEKAMLKLKIFRRLFPTIFLAGCVANNGIFGKTSIVHTMNEESE